ncbi:MAG: Gx transporter family protein [Chitinispirillaceae bacterium]|nr:Gx transporter family protein [Chitinispirillaceae bacterium]
MQSQDNGYSREIVYKTVLFLLAVGLNGIELFIPRIPFFPWLKPGLANIITIIWVIRYGTIDALLFIILRSWISGFYFGFSLITMILSFSGGIAATFTVGVAWSLLGKKGILGSVGLAIAGAFVHNAGQLLAVYFLFMKNDSIFYQIPFMMIASLVFGGVTGVLVNSLKSALDSRIPEHSFRGQTALKLAAFKKSDMVLSFIVLAVCIYMFFFEKITIIFIVTVIITCIAFFIENRKIRVVIYPLRFKYLLLFILLTYVIFTGGKRVLFLPIGTEEGFHRAAVQMLRLWAWIEAGIILNKLKCNELLFAILSKVFPGRKQTLAGGFAALVYFPEIISQKKKNNTGFGDMVKNPGKTFRMYLSDLFDRIENALNSKER